MQSDESKSREDILVAALLYLMTQYARTGCARLAVCISRHLQCLALHPRATSYATWTLRNSQPPHTAVH